MKISEVSIDDVMDYGKLDPDEILNLNIILPAAKSHIKSYTGLTDEQIDTKEDLTIALLVLCNEMCENRVYTVQNDKVNVVVKSILDKHCINLL